MVSFRNVLHFTTVALATIVQVRDVNTIINYLRAIDSACLRTSADAKAYDGTAGGSITIYNDLSDIDHKIQAATTDAQSEPQLSSSSSQTVCNYIASPLTPDFKAVLSIIVSFKPQFERNGGAPTVRKDLADIRQHMSALLDALNKVLSPDKKSSCNTCCMYSLERVIDAAVSQFAQGNLED